MKKLLLVLMLALVSAPALVAQTSYSCTGRIYCFWNEESEKFENCSNIVEESSLFVMNEGKTMFIHTTEEIKSTYYIESLEKLENGLIAYYVVSDVGNRYLYVFDKESSEIRCLINYEDGSVSLLTFIV